jgi:predicted nucleotidyltransferase
MGESIVETVKSAIFDIAPGSEVILFGSRARGDYKQDSDWDFLILLQTNTISKELKAEIQERLYEIELATDEVISAIIHTKLDWEKRAITPIYQIIKKEGLAA